MDTLDCIQGNCEWHDVRRRGYGQGISRGEDIRLVVQHRLSDDLVRADGSGGCS